MKKRLTLVTPPAPLATHARSPQETAETASACPTSEMCNARRSPRWFSQLSSSLLQDAGWWTDDWSDRTDAHNFSQAIWGGKLSYTSSDETISSYRSVTGPPSCLTVGAIQ